jgi:hypothetical protein
MTGVAAIVRSLTATLLRFGKLAALFLAGLSVFVFLPAWPLLDARLGSALIAVGGHRQQLDPSIVAVDLPWTDVDHSAGELLALLQIFARPGTAVPRPRAIVIDMVFGDKGRSDRAVLRNLAGAIGALERRGTKVYVAVDPFLGTSDLVEKFMSEMAPEIRDVTRPGHTVWKIVSSSSPAPVLAYSAAILESSGVTVLAMPLAVKNDFSEPPDRTFAFAIGARKSFDDVTLTTQKVRANPADLGDKIVLVGSTDPAAHDVHHGLRGLETVAWAISERLTNGTGAHVSLYADPAVLAGFTLLLSLLAAIVFTTVFRLLRPRRIAVAAAAAAAFAIPVAVLVLVVAVLASQHVMYLQITVEIAGVALAVILCTVAGREQVRRDLLISSYLDGRKPVERRYDVFVSYSRDDENAAWVERNVVEPLRVARNADGKPLAIFFDRTAIRDGASWYDSILAALWGSDTMIAVYTARYFERRTCTDELLTAMRRRIDDASFTVLPLSRIADGVPLRYRGIQYVDVVRHPDFMDELLATLSHRESGDRAAPHANAGAAVAN